MVPDQKTVDRPLPAIAEAFKELEDDLNKGSGAVLRVRPFSHACSLISILFGHLGMVFKFAEKDYVSKVEDLKGAAKQFDTLPVMVDHDISKDAVRAGGSHTRNLLRVVRGIDMVRVLFQYILVTEGNSLRDPAAKAYEQVFAPHHSWTIRKAVGAGMFLLPSKTQFLKKLNEEEDTARLHMQGFVTSAAPVIEHVNNLYLSKDLGIDW